MRQWILDILNEVGMKYFTSFLSYVLTLAAMAAICLAGWLLFRGITVRVAKAVICRTKSNWDDIFFKNKVFHRASAVVVPVMMLSFSGQMQPYDGLLIKLGHTFSVVVTVLVMIALIRTIDEIYSMYEVSKIRPIRGLLQVTQVTAYIIGGIVVVAVLAGQSPMAMLGGIGALTAVITLIFKDAILGFVSGIQLTSNDMIRIGDWIEMPKHNANGYVTDLSMTTVKVQNFDKTITSIPAYALISDSFVNWRSMFASGGRRIKRSIYIDASGVAFCDTEMINRFSRIGLLQDYITEKPANDAVNDATNDYANDTVNNSAKNHANNSVSNSVNDAINDSVNDLVNDLVNGQRLTNLGAFRLYIMRYLSQHPQICHDMLCMARHLAPCEWGIPIEIYAFTSTTVWTEYESIQADIFDHLYAIIAEFGLRIYQKPSSADFHNQVFLNDAGK